MTVEVVLAVKTLKVGKAAGCDEIRLEILIALNRPKTSSVSSEIEFWNGTERFENWHGHSNGWTGAA